MRAREKRRIMSNSIGGNASYTTLFMDKIGKVERNSYIRVAKDLGYCSSIIEKIQKAETEQEVSRIMSSARHEAIDNEQYFEQ